MKNKINSWLTLAGALLLLILFFRWWILEAVLVNEQSVNAWTDAQQADCAIVLTGERNRLDEGLDLLYQSKVKKLIISGVNPTSHLEEIFPHLMFYGKVQKEDIILEKNSKTTYGNAQQTLPLIEALKCQDVILITSRVHMRRSLKTFQATFPPNITIYPRATLGRQNSVPFEQLAIESLKSIFYSPWAY
jgi:uncharacterized SAM-binding protein YcdF (DUF218 family)